MTYSTLICKFIHYQTSSVDTKWFRVFRNRMRNGRIDGSEDDRHHIFMNHRFTPVDGWLICGKPWVAHDNIFVPNICNQETKDTSLPFCLYVEIGEVGDGPSFV